MSRRNCTVLAMVTVIGLVAGLVPGRASAQSGGGLQWSITPYIWGTQTSIDLAFRDREIASGEISFRDLIDMMDGAFMVHVETGKGHWSGFADLTYLKISDQDTRTLGPQGRELTIDSESEQVFLDAAIAYWPGGQDSGLSVFGGLRYTGLDDRFKFSIGSTEISDVRSDKNYSDALLGVRYRWGMTPRWDLLLHADGSFGSSEGTWMLRGLLGYTVGKRQMNRILFGYQYKQAEFEDGDVKLDITYKGPLAGFNFRF